MKTSMKILIFTICLIAIIPLAVFASTLTLKVTTDKSKYEVGDDVTVTVDWTEKMQAASFVLKYDSDVLEFKSASVASSNYNSDTVGEISVNWASLEEKDLTKMTFEFKTKKTGTANVSIKSANAFALLLETLSSAFLAFTGSESMLGAGGLGVKDPSQCFFS